VSVILAALGSSLALALAAAGGGLVLLKARIGSGPVDLLVRALLGLALLSSFHVHVAVGLTLALLIAGATWRGHGLEDAVLEDARKPTLIALGAIALVVTVALLRPPVPIFGSESELVGLARAISLREELPTSDRSLALPVISSALALGSDALTPLSVSSHGMVLASFALFALLVARSARGAFDEALPLVVLATVPFVWVHVRAASVELTLGLLAASMALGAERAGRGDRLGAPAAISAALLLAMGDAGIVLAVAVALAFMLTPSPAGARRTVLMAVTCLGLATVAERWGAPRTTLVDLDLSSSGPLVLEALRHVTDVQTWGLAPAVGLAALVASLRPSATHEQRALTWAIGLAIVMMLVVLVLAPIELRDRALDGGLLNRLALTLLPLGALAIARALHAPAGPRAA
jgi:hypothetical protein